MNVSLTPELDRYVHDKVKSGRYNSASEVLREALRTMQDQENLKALQIADVRRKIQEGIDDLDNGRYITGTIAELRAGTKARGRAALEKSKA